MSHSAGTVSKLASRARGRAERNLETRRRADAFGVSCGVGGASVAVIVDRGGGAPRSERATVDGQPLISVQALIHSENGTQLSPEPSRHVLRGVAQNLTSLAKSAS